MATETLPRGRPGAGEWTSPAPATLLGRYRLHTAIASGGMGSIWIASDVASETPRLVALKLIRSDRADDARARGMFFDEARIAGLICHPNVVRMFGFGDERGVLYQAMELVEGVSLAALSQHHPDPLPIPIALRILCDALHGLHAAHELRDERGAPLALVHRDVSPHNILVDLQGVTRISDFGIAKALGRLQDETETGDVKGKLAYMAPEQLSRGEIDRRTDIFAAGIISWEVLAGQQLFRGADLVETMNRVVKMTIPDPRSARALPDRIAEVVMKALAPAAADRFITADLMRSELEAAADGQIASVADVGAFVTRHAGRELDRLRLAIKAAREPESSDKRAGAPRRRRAIWVAASALVIACAVIVPLTWNREQAPKAESTSEASSPNLELGGSAVEEAKPVPPVEQPQPVEAVQPPRHDPRPVRRNVHVAPKATGAAAVAPAQTARPKFGNPYTP